MRMQKRQARAVASEPSRHSSPADWGLLSAAPRTSSSSRFSLRRVGSQRVERMGLSRKSQSRSLDRLSVNSSCGTRRSIGTIAVDDDPESSVKGSRHELSASSSSWSRLATVLPTLCRSSSKKAPATTMYSISFFPWKMEAFGYYSSPWAAAAWVPDTASMRCQICLAAFTLMRRRHHCRLCGHLVCNDCSLPRTFLPFLASARSQHHMIRDGEPQRTCNSCANTLQNMAAQHDLRVHKFTVRPASRAAQGHVSVDRPRHWRAHLGSRRHDAHTERDDYGKQEQEQRLTCGFPGVEYYPLRLSVCQAEELDEILYARALSRSKSMSKQFVVSSQWLEQWLQYVHMDSGSSHLSSSDDNRTKRNSPRPGPVTNYSLLDFVNGSLVPKKSLERSVVGSVDGDYHVVSEEVWLAFLRLYGGGPSIQAPASSVESSRTASEAGDGSLVSCCAQSNDRESTSRWVITELGDSPAPAATVPVGLAPRRVGSVSYRKTELWVAKTKKKKATSVSSGNLRLSPDSRSSWAPRGLKSDRDSHKRWTLARAFSFRKSTKRPEDVISQVVEGAILYNPDDCASDAPSRARIDSRELKASSTRGVEALDHRRERRTEIGASRLSEEADAPYSRSTIAAISAFAHAATEARRRSAMSLSRHPSSRLIGPPSNASAA